MILLLRGVNQNTSLQRHGWKISAKRCGVSLKEVFVIPGNHDVVRSTAKPSNLKYCHKEIRNASSLSVDSVISGLLKDRLAGPLLYKSIEPYNGFAGKFLCSLLPPDRTICERRVTFQRGWTVRFLGVNSTFISGENNKERGLYVDVAAKQISTEPGTINVVLCHHPYGWLANGDVFADHLATVSQLQMFGHLHTNRIKFTVISFVLLRAWQRDRQEHGWEPGYNSIELELTGTQESPRLRVRVHVRVWQERPGRFRAKQDRNHSDVFEQEIMLEPWAGGDFPAEVSSEATATQPRVSNPSEDSMESLRNLSIRFG